MYDLYSSHPCFLDGDVENCLHQVNLIVLLQLVVISDRKEGKTTICDSELCPISF